MTLLYFFKSRAYVGFDKADLYRKKKKYQEYEERIAAELLKAALQGEDVVIPENNKLNLKIALGEKLTESVNDKEKQALKLLILMLAMED